MNQQKYLKEGFTFIFWFMLTFHSNIIWINSIFSCNFTFINPKSAQFRLKYLKKTGNFAVLACCAAENYYINMSKVACLTQNFVYNQMDLLLASIRIMK